ncbi:F-box domain [Cedratvirus A11]|uniref:F-box domain n=1 Tax=Cedratvirus A11 TaxID=1903266 RepID=A0A1M7XUK0_9VIRU|nr:F-box domain [Cedratvirus A11]SHO33352.1 F-box domain [Cedratvirus A11]
MSELSLEVIFAILESTEVDDLFKLSSICVQFRQTCKDKVLWKRIFNKHNLVMLKKSRSISTWISNFILSVMCKEKIDKYMQKVDKARNIGTVVMPVQMSEITDASAIHIPKVTNKDDLERFINKAKISYLNPIGTTREHKKSGLTTVYLTVSKMAGKYYMFIEEKHMLTDKTKATYGKYKLNREQLYLLFHKLAHHTLFSENQALMEREKQSTSLRTNQMEKFAFSHGYFISTLEESL